MGYPDWNESIERDQPKNFGRKEKKDGKPKEMVQKLKEEALALSPVESIKEKSPLPHRVEEDAFAVIHVTGTQYKVTPGDVIITQTLDGPDIGDEIVLDKVLLIGTKSWTAIGAPLLNSAHVHAVVEEQTKTRKVLVFKKKRRKNYRRTNGHRQPITTLRITDITFDRQHLAKPVESHQTAASPNPSSNTTLPQKQHVTATF